MARGTQLIKLVDQLRSELKESSNPASGVNTLESYKYVLNAQQEFLYHDYAWPFLRGHFDVEMQAGERYYDLPVDPGTISRYEFKWNDIWSPIVVGIGASNYNSQDSDRDQRADPVQNWQFEGDTQFEVWPVPASNGGTVRFWGRQALTKMVKDTDRCILDDRLIVLFAAANRAPKETYQRKLAEANSYYRALKKRFTNGSRGFVLGGGQGNSTGRSPPGHVRVAEANRSGS
jgi:hypothetical protein